MSMTPAFSPGPWITHGALVGRPRRCTFEDLYEQCSFHIAETMPSSVKLGSRPISARKCSYSSGFRPCSAISAGVIFGSLGIISGGFERLDHAFEQPATVGGANSRIDMVFGVRHQAEYVLFLRENPGDRV